MKSKYPKVVTPIIRDNSKEKGQVTMKSLGSRHTVFKSSKCSTTYCMLLANSFNLSTHRKMEMIIVSASENGEDYMI